MIPSARMPTETFRSLTLGASLVGCVAMFRRADDTVVLDESSIVYRVPGRPPVILQSPEITRVRDLLMRLEDAWQRGGPPR